MNKESKTIIIKYSFIKKIAFLYVSIPLLIFFIGWLKWYFAAIAVLAYYVCLFFMFFNRIEEECEDYITVPVSYPFVVYLVSLVYCFFCGIGRLWAQSPDYPWRNAVLRDLILRDWPVLYPKYDGALSYYIGLWLPSALIGKIFYLLGAGTDAAFFVGNIALLIYVSLGIFLLFMLIGLYLKPSKKIQLYLFILIFIFFSGMDILGSIEPFGANNFHLEWWAKIYQYSSFTTCMCWVFNQAIIPWICTLLILKERKVSNFVFLGMSCLFSGPMPFVGLFIFCIAIGIYKLTVFIKERKVKNYIKDIFSPSNILSAIIIFPFIALYFLSNYAFNGSGGFGVTSDAVIAGKKVELSFLNLLINYLKFILAEFLVLSICIFNRYKKNYLFYVMVVTLFVFPFIKVGYAYDFAMRASIPSLLLLYLFAVNYLFAEKIEKENYNNENANKLKNYNLKKIAYIGVIIFIFLGAFTPSVEFIRGFRQVHLRGVNDVVTDNIITFGEDSELKGYKGVNIMTYSNFISVDIDDKLFFKYLAQKDNK